MIAPPSDVAAAGAAVFMLAGTLYALWPGPRKSLCPGRQLLRRYTGAVTRRATQFAVAIAGTIGLVIATIIALVGELFFDGSTELTFALVTALTGLTGAAAAYLFRINGQSREE